MFSTVALKINGSSVGYAARVVWDISILVSIVLFCFLPPSCSELRQHCVLLHRWGKIQPHRLCPRSRAGAGAGVVTSFPRKSGLWPTCTQISLYDGTLLIQPISFMILPRVKAGCSSCVRAVTWSRCRVLIQRPRNRPKPSSCLNCPADLSVSGASNLESRSGLGLS